MPTDVSTYLNSLQRDECFRVERMLSSGKSSLTELVWFKGSNGSEQGPYVRKRFPADAGIGDTYSLMRDAYASGRRFLHLPRIVDYYRTGEEQIVIMEYIAGETLTEAVDRCGSSLDLAHDLFPLVCDAVTELHESFARPVIHRDLKPSNVIVTNAGLFLIDFDIAREYRNDAETDTQHFGTRAFAPPEQFGFGQTDTRSDVYALGLLLFFCLTGRIPDAKARQEGFHDVQLPEALSAVVRMAAAFDPSARYASARELKQAFLKAAESIKTFPATSYAPNSQATAHTLTKPTVLVPTDPQPVASAPQFPRISSVSSGTPASSSLSSISSLSEPSARSAVDTVKNVSKTRVSRFASIVSRIPAPIGIVWDILLGLTFFICAIGAVSIIVSPPAGSDADTWNLFQRIVVYVGFLVLATGPVLYALSDRRPIRRLLPFLSQRPIWQETLIVAILVIVWVFLVGIVVSIA